MLSVIVSGRSSEGRRRYNQKSLWDVEKLKELWVVLKREISMRLVFVNMAWVKEKITRSLNGFT